MIVFRAETDPPPGTLRKALQSMEVLLKLGTVDPFEPNDSVTFFNEFYRKIDHDAHRVQPLRRALAFATVAETFKMIDMDSLTIIVPYRNETIDGPARIAEFRARPTLQTIRALQPLSVHVRRYQRDALREAGITMSADDFDRFDVICEGRQGSYDETYGLQTTADPLLPIDASII
jgi:CRISPR-associated endonuclease/helicase Cas3